MSAYEWRAVAKDNECGEGDEDGPFATREEAEVALVLLLDADPPYDEGWVERRPIAREWERLR